jgi:hypothetical protein
MVSSYNTDKVYVSSTAVWYVFVVLNTLQGLFIFVAYSCTNKVWQELRRKEIPSTQTANSTLGASKFKQSGVLE